MTLLMLLVVDQLMELEQKREVQEYVVLLEYFGLKALKETRKGKKSNRLANIVSSRLVGGTKVENLGIWQTAGIGS